MQGSDIEKHMYATSTQGDEEESKGEVDHSDADGGIKTVPIIKKALVHDLV